MTSVTENPANPMQSQSPYTTDAPANIARAYWLSIGGLLVSVLALGLATIPAIAFEQPLANPFAKSAKNELPKVPLAEAPEREGGVTLKYKKTSITFGGRTPESPEKVTPQSPPVTREMALTSDPARWFIIAATICALGGIVVAAVGQTREKHSVLTASSLSCCAAAIAWPYVAVGIALGAAIAVLLLVLAMLGSVLN